MWKARGERKRGHRLEDRRGNRETFARRGSGSFVLYVFQLPILLFPHGTSFPPSTPPRLPFARFAADRRIKGKSRAVHPTCLHLHGIVCSHKLVCSGTEFLPFNSICWKTGGGGGGEEEGTSGGEFLNFFPSNRDGLGSLYRETERDCARDIARIPVTRLSTEFLFQRFLVDLFPSRGRSREILLGYPPPASDLGLFQRIVPSCEPLHTDSQPLGVNNRADVVWRLGTRESFNPN